MAPHAYCKTAGKRVIDVELRQPGGDPFERALDLGFSHEKRVELPENRCDALDHVMSAPEYARELARARLTDLRSHPLNDYRLKKAVDSWRD